MSEHLKNIKGPGDLKGMSVPELKALAQEIRERLVDVTSKKGGHLAASLGAVEIAIALHYTLKSPQDKIVWDVGHQSYAHKLLTGREEHFDTLREMGGISGFPKREESEHDIFTSGHASTSISSAIGLAQARDLKGEDHKVVAVIGDASLSAGLAFEGMNHAGHTKTNFAVILNDNEHSISKPVGAMSRCLNQMISNPLYNRVRDEAEKVVKSIPRLGPAAVKKVKKFQEGLKNLIVPGILFEELGFRYFGPIDGHDLEGMISMFGKILPMKEPVLIHVITKKGKGYKFAEEDPTTFHGVDAFDVEEGSQASSKKKSFTEHFSDKMAELGKKNKDIVAVTAAMPGGTGLSEFGRLFPDRTYDVGITEAHAVTFAAGLARGGLKPVVAVYSTFMQRAYDQLIHDVALQKLPVVFCLDRAGLVGKDGPTHHGAFDLSYTRNIPGFTVMAPKDGEELEQMLERSFEWNRPVVIRYPRGEATQLVSASSCAPLEYGKAESLRQGKDFAVIALGCMVNTSLRACDMLSGQGIEGAVINARFVKPLDSVMLEEVFHKHKKVFTIEEGVASGGFGGAVLEFAERENISGVKIRCIGLPDEFIEHGSQEELRRKYHLTPDELAGVIKSELGK
ncbi:MAG: 1-deoxy-D-xylulose-5-phosphate synthase [Candidatus Omnitrophica bacterium]|nr:1-deoxy-D-xylulose-5-phosphate synthase [Candidatus Omnitrophota bacterium]